MHPKTICLQWYWKDFLPLPIQRWHTWLPSFLLFGITFKTAKLFAGVLFVSSMIKTSVYYFKEEHGYPQFHLLCSRSVLWTHYLKNENWCTLVGTRQQNGSFLKGTSSTGNTSSFKHIKFMHFSEEKKMLWSTEFFAFAHHVVFETKLPGKRWSVFQPSDL